MASADGVNVDSIAAFEHTTFPLLRNRCVRRINKHFTVEQQLVSRIALWVCKHKSSEINRNKPERNKNLLFTR